MGTDGKLIGGAQGSSPGTGTGDRVRRHAHVGRAGWAMDQAREDGDDRVMFRVDFQYVRDTLQALEDWFGPEVWEPVSAPSERDVEAAARALYEADKASGVDEIPAKVYGWENARGYYVRRAEAALSAVPSRPGGENLARLVCVRCGEPMGQDCWKSGDTHQCGGQIVSRGELALAGSRPGGDAERVDERKWTRAFNRLEKAVSTHIDQKPAVGFHDEADDALHAAYRAVMKDVGPLREAGEREPWKVPYGHPDSPFPNGVAGPGKEGAR